MREKGPARQTSTNQALLQRREHVMGPTYHLFYREPVHLVKGEGVWLFDADGKKYLDCYNNVASVGHCHPHVVNALSKQAATLNTHTRYLHEHVVNYAERLTATLPGDLSVCMFVCTGTEANDLAFRIARTISGHQGAIVSDHSYHGNSIVVTELSTAEYPVSEQPEWLATAEPPNGFRGSFRYGEADLGPKYATKVGEAIKELEGRGQQPAMFMTCNIFDSNGALPAPEGYFREAYARVRAAGGLCVADEVQSGLCRLGDHVWGFEDSDVVPDIVTMGKPIGDGHPLAAVVTTPAIAQAFAEKFHYFNTFGGNPVSAAVGLAVLDVIEQENILQNVHDTGQYLVSNLRSLAKQYGCIGDVRGKGLFYGLEIVREAGSLEADTARANQIAEAMRESGVLLSTTGPFDNVVKIRPPMVFSKANADVLVNALNEVMARL